jgi:DNA-binding NtrC family response regulator
MLFTRPPVASTGPFDILLVDDEPVVLRVITRILRMAGHDVSACSGLPGVEAYLYAGARPDLLITDVVLNGSTGKRVAAVVQEKSPKTRTLFMSGYGNIAVGGQPVISKPFKNHELIELIDQVMSASSNATAHEREEEFVLSRKKH